MNAIEVTKLSKRYRDTTAVDDLSFSVAQGECFALLGVNGAGKSTTIRMLSALIPPTSGDALLMGHSIVREPLAVKACISVSPQETATAPKLSVRENLELIAGLHGAGRAAARDAADAMLRDFSMLAIQKKAAGTLSGGWQRRLGIAMALIPNPQVLFLDEPTLGLDVLARRELWEMTEKLRGRVTLVLTTHDLEEAEALADHIGILANGTLAALGSAAELKEKAGCERFEDAFIALSGKEKKS